MYFLIYLVIPLKYMLKPTEEQKKRKKEKKKEKQFVPVHVGKNKIITEGSF